jgi:hypothetical protein
VRRLILRILDRLAKLRSQLWILDGYRFVDGGMAGDIGRIVRQRAQCEGVLVHILTLDQQLVNEVPAANVMHQVAEFGATEWVVAKILDDGAAGESHRPIASPRFPHGSERSMRTSRRCTSAP